MPGRGDVPLLCGYSDGCGSLSEHDRQVRQDVADRLLEHILNLKENGIGIGLALLNKLNQDYDGEFNGHVQQVLNKQSDLIFEKEKPSVQMNIFQGDKHEHHAGSKQVNVNLKISDDDRD